MNILITGGTMGIGRSAVEALRKEGHTVIFVGRTKGKGDELAASTGAQFIQADLSDMSECTRVIDEVFDTYETCDVLVNNAGLWTEGNLEDTELIEIEKVMTINALSPMVLTREYLRRLRPLLDKKDQTGARIIFINSSLGLNIKAGRGVYAASKWALTGFGRTLVSELAGDNIGVTNFYPTYVGTELFDNAGYHRDLDGSLDPDHVGEAIRYICSLAPEVAINEFGIKPTSRA